MRISEIRQNVKSPTLKQIPVTTVGQGLQPMSWQPQYESVKDKKLNTSNVIKYGSGALVLAGIVFVAIKSLKRGKKPSQITTNNNLIEKPKEIFDIEYKKGILKSMGIDESKIESLKSIAGKDEFLNFLNQTKNNNQIYSVGRNFEHVKNKDFGANLHIHTTFSDGQMTVDELLDISANYANKFAQKNNKPFYIGITDHNTVLGNIEALKIITKNPKKFENLRVVLGNEINAIEGERQIHTLAYCLNPFDSPVAKAMSEQLNVMQNNIHNVISNANNNYSWILNKYKFNFAFDDMAKIRASIKSSPCDVNYSMKDYMQFRLIYADVIENNGKLLNFLNKNNVSLNDLDFSIPKYKISPNNCKSPYYENYIDELQKYIKQVLNTKNAQSINEVDRYFKPINEDTLNVLRELEYKTLDRNSPLHTYGSKYKSLDEVLNLFESDKQSLCGFAHPCLIYNKNGSVPKDSYELRHYLENIYNKFSERRGVKFINEAYYQAYYPDVVKEDFVNYTKTAGEIRGFINTGSYDSHNNNPFTDQKHLAKEFIQELIS